MGAGWRVWLVLGFCLLAGPAPAWAAPASAPLIASAASLRFALVEILAAFENQTGESVRVSFGSSGNLTRQINQGAPFELFLSADEAQIFRLTESGKARDRGIIYARGRLALFAPNGSAFDPEQALTDLKSALSAPSVRRVAIANPAHAPYGRAAEQALRHAGAWEAVQPKLLFGENVAQAAQFALSGPVQGALLANSLIRAPELARRGRGALIPESWHEPLNQRMVLLNGAGDVAVRLYGFMQMPAARKILARYGFSVPAEGE